MVTTDAPQLYRAAAILMLVLVTGACGNTSGTLVGQARSELNAAIARTIEAPSLHMESSSAAPEAGGTSSTDYNAPDRVRTVSEDGSESILIGNSVYVSDFGKSGQFLSSTRPGPSPARNLFVLLEAARRAESVKLDGDEFVASLGENAGTLSLQVRGGYVVRIRLQSGANDEHMDATYEFSRFGSAPKVTAPPPNKVSVAPTTPECPADSETPKGLFVCTGGELSEPEEVDLPAPSEPTDSTLQFRPVRADASAGCQANDENPPADTPVVLADSEGHCLDLAAAGLEVERVKELHARRQGEDITLGIALNTADARRLDQVAGDHVGDRLAVVFLGRVVSAPTIQATEFQGRLELNGLTIAEAARVKAALT